MNTCAHTMILYSTLVFRCVGCHQRKSLFFFGVCTFSMTMSQYLISVLAVEKASFCTASIIVKEYCTHIRIDIVSWGLKRCAPTCMY